MRKLGHDKENKELTAIEKKIPDKKFGSRYP